MKKNKQLKKRMENKSLLIWKMAIASALSWEIAKLLGSNHPYLAPISVILCIQTTVNKSIRFSYHRMVGTVIGIIAVVLASPYLKVNGWTLGLLILLGSFIAKWLKRDESAIHQTALTVLLVFVMEHKSGDYPIDRFRDTLVGAIVAVLLHMIVKPPNYLKDAEESVEKLSNQVNSLFYRVANWVGNDLKGEEGNSLPKEVQELLHDVHLTNQIIKDAAESLKYNFFAKENAVFSCQQKLDDLTHGYTFLTNVIETLKEWSSLGTLTPDQTTIWAEQIKNLAPLFSAKRNPKEQIPTGRAVMVTLPIELETQQFYVSLYHETVSLVRKLNNFQN